MKQIDLNNRKTLIHRFLKKRSVIALICIPFLLSNCEEVMEDFTLKNAEPELVIDAFLSSNSDSLYVFLSKTANYMNPVSYPTVSGANVLLSFSDTSILVPEVAQGTYILSHPFTEQTNYELQITTEDVTYTARTFVPRLIPIDSTRLIVSPFSPFMARYPGELFYEISFFIQDPQEDRNFYRIKIWKNDTLLNSANDILVFEDRLINGKTFEVMLNGYFFEENNNIHIELWGIDEANYRFYLQLREAMTSTGNFSVPDNPKSNFSPSVLGHFVGFSKDTSSVYVSPFGVYIP